MEKILKPYTIIPPHLYIKRSADRQLRDIISDMGRPGYVLVSRQMGKTNLLLNAKRELSNENDKFVYIDLSTAFDNEQSCFQNIIDIALETNEESYVEASKIIADNRKKQSDFPPHKQHTSELRILLKHTKGKLIIILDEIDALTKTQYSDKIFAQIRSVYFSRVNFPELERLTYIISGVVEPSEIIKDPKISPFNIGEKIFLNDFSKDEFLAFIEKSNLNSLSEELIERIFYWTNGNPRMTWDLCSEIENKKLDIKSKEQIDEIVQKHYLTSFDKPPIDNIREIVIADKSIRDAIVEIDYSKGKEVADNIKSKLYLAGIINYEEDDIKIKNRIIKNTLNKNWLDSIKEQEQGLLNIALELSRKGKHLDAIVIYEKFMATNEFPNKETEVLSYYNLGLAFYTDSQYDKAIEYLSKGGFDVKEYPKLVYKTKNIIGLCYYYLKEYDNSLEYFKFVIDANLKDELYGKALLNYGAACVNTNNENLKTEAISIFENIILEENFDKESISEIDIDELKSISNYNIGLLYQESDLNKARLHFEKALKTKKNELKPTFYLSLINCNVGKKEKEALLNSLVDFIIVNKIIPAEKDPERPLDISIEKLEEIIVLAFQVNIDDFEKILNYSLTAIYSSKEVIQVLFELSFLCIKNKKVEVGIDILKYIYTKYHSELIQNTNIYQYDTLKVLSYFIKADVNIAYSEEYLRSLKEKRLAPIDDIDFDIVSNIIVELIQKKEYEKVDEYLNLFYSLKLEVNEDLLINYLALNYFDLQIKISTGNNIEAKFIAENILDDINSKKYKNEQSNLLGEKGLEDIKRTAYTYLSPYPTRQPIRVEKSYGRNDIVQVRYNDGRTEQKKFKKVEQDIANKLCTII